MDFNEDNGYQTRLFRKFVHLENWLSKNNKKNSQKSETQTQSIEKSYNEYEDIEEMIVVSEEHFHRVKSDLEFKPILPASFRYIGRGLFLSTQPLTTLDEVRTLKTFFEIETIFDVNIFPTIFPKNPDVTRAVGMESSLGVPVIKFLDIDPGVNYFAEKSFQVYFMPTLKKEIPIKSVYRKFKKKMERDGNKLIICYNNRMAVFYLICKWMNDIGVWDEKRVRCFLNSTTQIDEIEIRMLEDSLFREESKELYNERKVRSLGEMRKLFNYFLSKDYTLIVKKEVEKYVIDEEMLKKKIVRFKLLEKTKYLRGDKIFDDLVWISMVKKFNTLESVTKEFKSYRSYSFLKKYFVNLLRLFNGILKENHEYQRRRMLLDTVDEKRKEEEGETDESYYEGEKPESGGKTESETRESNPKGTTSQEPMSPSRFFDYRNKEMGELALTKTEIEWEALKSICQIDIRSMIELKSILKKLDKIRYEEEVIVRRKTNQLTLEFEKEDLGLKSEENQIIVKKLQKKKKEKLEEIAKVEQELKVVVKGMKEQFVRKVSEIPEKKPEKPKQERVLVDFVPNVVSAMDQSNIDENGFVRVRPVRDRTFIQFKLSKTGSRTFMSHGENDSDARKVKKKRRKFIKKSAKKGVKTLKKAKPRKKIKPKKGARFSKKKNEKKEKKKMKPKAKKKVRVQAKNT